MSDGDLASAVAALTGCHDGILGRPGVTGVGVGYKRVNGELTDDVAIRVYVSDKRASVPDAERGAPAIHGVLTDVIQADYSAPRLGRVAPGAHANPAHPGLAIAAHGTPIGDAGTLGAFLRPDAGADVIYGLTAAHVLDIGGGGPEVVFEPHTSREGQDILGATFRVTSRDSVECGVFGVTLSDDRKAHAWPFALEGPFGEPTEPELGMAVMKVGAATGVTHGTIDAIQMTYRYTKTIDLTRQIHVAAQPGATFALHGDSGSVIVTADSERRPVGLIWGGFDDGSAVASHMTDVLATVQMHFMG